MYYDVFWYIMMYYVHCTHVWSLDMICNELYLGNIWLYPEAGSSTSKSSSFIPIPGQGKNGKKVQKPRHRMWKKENSSKNAMKSTATLQIHMSIWWHANSLASKSCKFNMGESLRHAFGFWFARHTASQRLLTNCSWLLGIVQDVSKLHASVVELSKASKVPRLSQGKQQSHDRLDTAQFCHEPPGSPASNPFPSTFPLAWNLKLRLASYIHMYYHILYAYVYIHIYTCMLHCIYIYMYVLIIPLHIQFAHTYIYIYMGNTKVSAPEVRRNGPPARL